MAALIVFNSASIAPSISPDGVPEGGMEGVEKPHIVCTSVCARQTEPVAQSHIAWPPNQYSCRPPHIWEMFWPCFPLTYYAAGLQLWA